MSIQIKIYVRLEDLDRDFTDDSHPTLKQVRRYLRRANSLLTNWFQSNGVNDNFGGAKEVGIQLTEILIHNRRYNDGMVEYEKRFAITREMESILLSENFDISGGFTYNPTGSFLPGG